MQSLTYSETFIEHHLCAWNSAGTLDIKRAGPCTRWALRYRIIVATARGSADFSESTMVGPLTQTYWSEVGLVGGDVPLRNKEKRCRSFYLFTTAEHGQACHFPFEKSGIPTADSGP